MALIENQLTGGVTSALPAVKEDFEIPEANLVDLRAKFEKLNRRATKLGLAHIQLIEGERFNKQKEVFDEFGVAFTPARFTRVPYIRIKVSGTTPRLNGWDFIATLQHLGEDGNLIASVPGLDVAIPHKFRSAGSDCEHCCTTRRRTDTFLLREADTGRWMQVGRNCLADFLRTTNVQDLATMAELLMSAMSAASDAGEEGGGGGASKQTNLVALISAVAAQVRYRGAFVSRSKAKAAMNIGDVANATATVDRALRVLYPSPSSKIDRDEKITPADHELAEKIVAWAREEVPALAEKESDNDYLYNLSIVIKRDWLDGRMLGLAGSVIAVYNRDLVKKATIKRNLDTSKSTYIGAEGDKFKFLPVTLLNVFEHNGVYGTSYITKMTTDDGNLLVWFASNRITKTVEWVVPAEEPGRARAPWMREPGSTQQRQEPVAYGERVFLSGTIKKLEERQGIKQTIVTRCAVAYEPAMAAEIEKDKKKAERAAKKAAKAAK